MKRIKNIPAYIILLSSLLLIIILAVIFVPILNPMNLKETNLRYRLSPPKFIEPNSDFIFGTDHLGRDFLYRTIYGARTSLTVAGGSIVIASLLGIILGILSGAMGGNVDLVISFLVDAKLAIPTKILALAAASIIGSGIPNMILIIGFSGFASFTRIVRSEIIRLKNANFIKASQAMGASLLRIAWEHYLPNIMSLIFVNATIRFSGFIMLESSLSFLGLGVQPPNVSLGIMVSEGRNYLMNEWWLSIIPSILISLIILSSSALGDWLRDVLDPKSKKA